MTGQDPLGLSDATTALGELADLTELEDALRQDYPGARLDDIDEEAVRRALGRQAVDDMEALRQIERELERQGYLQRNDGKLELTPKAVRRLGETALRHVFADLPEGRHGDHDQQDAGQAGEHTGSTRPWTFGDEQAIDAAATVRNALLHGGAARRGRRRPARRSSDFEVAETERRDRGRGLPAGRPVVLDGAARHLGRGQADRAGPARAGPTRYPQDSFRSSAFRTMRANCARPSSPGSAGIWSRALTCTTR